MFSKHINLKDLLRFFAVPLRHTYDLCKFEDLHSYARFCVFSRCWCSKDPLSWGSTLAVEEATYSAAGVTFIEA